MIEKKSFTLVGGPFDGLELDLWSDAKDCYVAPHHQREYGHRGSFKYVRVSRSQFYYER